MRPQNSRTPQLDRKLRTNTRLFISVLFCISVFTSAGFGLGQDQYVATVKSPHNFTIAHGKTLATIYVDAEDHAGVVRAAHDLQEDVARVTGKTPALKNTDRGLGANAIIIGTVGKSPIIERLIRERKIDVSAIAGKWESFIVQVVRRPLPGVANGLIIAGSDKRGTIYGIYDLSEEMGVSPWYWWADVPPQHKETLYVKAGKYVQGPPAVKYRGIFLNDEAPSLSGWVKEKYGTYNHEFYTKVFELLLRLKANYLWPAMWDNSFDTDDPLNPKLADEYGIVMGTSHQEPMMRAWKEWDREGHGVWDYSKNASALDDFWRQGIERNKNYETITTIGMRGNGDEPMSEGANINLLEKIVANQRNIISEVTHKDPATVPQDWALYKEVQQYYEKGMRAPDDVTLLWADDNWGDIRRLPTPAEQKRAGGAGIYYHFDYVGGPRSYRWLNTNPLPKIWEQMNLAYHYDANRIWVVNVGDLKPMELPISFFLNLAWNPRQWPKEDIDEFTRQWAEQQFGPKYAPEIADILSKYGKYNGLRKPELLSPETFSQVDYEEADRMMDAWKSITNEAEEIYQKLPENERDAFFELVLYPTKASAQVAELYITAGKNHLYASQGRASANALAAQARALFQADADLSSQYNHELARGKWDHMMDQTHIGYTGWNEPPKNIMPKVSELDVPATATMGIAVEGSAASWPGMASATASTATSSNSSQQNAAPAASSDAPALPEFDVFNQQRRYIDVFNRGQGSFDFTASASDPWIIVSSSHGSVGKEQRLWVSINWARVPKGLSQGSVKISGPGAEDIPVKIEAFNPQNPQKSSLHGFVEANGYVSIEAEHFTRKIGTGDARWEKVPDYGRTLSGMSIFPVAAQSVAPPRNSPCLQYTMYLFDSGTVNVRAILGPTLNFVPGRGLRYAVSFDNQAPKIVDALADNSQRAWARSVEDNAREISSTLTLDHPGYHTLKVWMVYPGVVLQKIIVDFGGAKPSYLGPPESYYETAAAPGL